MVGLHTTAHNRRSGVQDEARRKVLLLWSLLSHCGVDGGVGTAHETTMATFCPSCVSSLSDDRPKHRHLTALVVCCFVTDKNDKGGAKGKGAKKKEEKPVDAGAEKKECKHHRIMYDRFLSKLKRKKHVKLTKISRQTKFALNVYAQESIIFDVRHC